MKYIIKLVDQQDGEVYYHRDMNWMMVTGDDPVPIHTEKREEAKSFSEENATKMVKCYTTYDGGRYRAEAVTQ